MRAKNLFKIIGWTFVNIFNKNKCSGVDAGGCTIDYTPVSAEYLKEIEENDECSVACAEYANDAEFIAAIEASATARREGIDNTIQDEETKENFRALNKFILIPLFADSGWLQKITSGFRAFLLNIAVGGARTSQHQALEDSAAVDIRAYALGRRISIFDIARRVVMLCLPFDQMILYGTFLHLSFRRFGKNRGQIIYHSSYTGARL